MNSILSRSGVWRMAYGVLRIAKCYNCYIAMERGFTQIISK